MVSQNDFHIINGFNFSCMMFNNDYWFTQKTISQILGTTPQNITLHLREIYKFKSKDDGCQIFPVSKKEGSREVKRNSKHYNLETFYDIATRAKRFEEFNEVLSWLKKDSEVSFEFRITPVKERNFKEILDKTLKGVEGFCYQYRVLDYWVDFFFPRLNLIVEFDEIGHKQRANSDEKRQKHIETNTGFRFIRVQEGEELEGLNKILQLSTNRGNFKGQQFSGVSSVDGDENI